MAGNVNKNLFLYKDPNEKGIIIIMSLILLINLKILEVNRRLRLKIKKAKIKIIKVVLFFLMEQKKKS